MSTGKTIRLQLPERYVGQMMDGLEVLAEQWEQTAAVMDNDELQGDELVVRECSNADEARAIAAFYRRILENVAEQV